MCNQLEKFIASTKHTALDCKFSVAYRLCTLFNYAYTLICYQLPSVGLQILLWNYKIFTSKAKNIMIMQC